jgi:hypothetical protein
VTLECIPVKFEGSDSETGELVFTVEAFDQYAATVEIKGMVDVALWGEISSEVAKALVGMELKA